VGNLSGRGDRGQYANYSATLGSGALIRLVP
jgi:hypothetical protein